MKEYDNFDTLAFLPVSKEDMESRGWWWYDFLIVTGDAYVDHPSFGPTVIARVLEAEGFRFAILAQPDWHSAEAFKAMGRPRLGVMIGSGNLDSMVAHYTAAKKRRSEDFYSPGKKAGLRPDRAMIVYANRAREAFPDLPIIIGGLEASLRRFAHYDYWEDKVRRSALVDAGAGLLVYGMGEYASAEIARRLKKKQPVSSMTDIRGTAFMASGHPRNVSLKASPSPPLKRLAPTWRTTPMPPGWSMPSTTPSGGPSSSSTTGDILLSIPRPCPCPQKSWTGWRSCPTPGSTTQCTRLLGACLP